MLTNIQKTHEPKEWSILRAKALALKLSIGIPTLYDWLNPKSPRFDDSFPRPIKLGRSSVGWLSTEIDDWLLNKAEESRL